MSNASHSIAKILIVDDELEIINFMREFLVRRGYDVEGLSRPTEAASRLDAFRPDLCILDFRMPLMTGAEILDVVKKWEPTVEVIFMTGEDETALAVTLMKRGAIDYLLKPVDLSQLLVSVERALDHRRLVIENEKYRLHLEQLVLEKTAALNAALSNLSQVHLGTLDALSQALDFRDQSTSGHSRRVASLTAGVAESLGISGPALIQIEHGALLHDIGKLKIPDTILWKPAKLTEEEWKTMRLHPQYGYDFLNKIDFLKSAAELVYSHHEKFDGNGYPNKLRAEQIPFGARIFAIVDAVDAMIYKRPYHDPITFDESAEEVRRCAGTHFDPELTRPTLEYLADKVPQEVRNSGTKPMLS